MSTGQDMEQTAELDALRREVERVKWVTEVHLSRHGLWDKEVGLDIRAEWATGDDASVTRTGKADA